MELVKNKETISYCPLCDSGQSSDSWLGSTVFRDKEFFYRECSGCQSIYCAPMPDAEDLSRMYGEEYQKFYESEASHSGEGGVENVLNFLAPRAKGVFFDYGCGAGNLLKRVSRAGWECVGLEFDRRIAEKYGRLNGLKIVSALDDLPDNFCADVIHLGDVLEHLTDLNQQFPPILGLLRKGGIVIAQGPLEANSNLFLYGLRAGKIFNRAPSTMPPYHVSLATARGQREFFRRFGLQELKFSVFESAHPAPEKMSPQVVKNPRLGALFALRKASQLVSKFSRTMGNRYFYIGSKNE